MRTLVRPLIGHVYYGWVMLCAVSITEVVSWGILYYAFAVFVTPMQTELGWSRVGMGGSPSVECRIGTAW